MRRPREGERKFNACRHHAPIDRWERTDGPRSGADRGPPRGSCQRVTLPFTIAKPVLIAIS